MSRPQRAGSQNTLDAGGASAAPEPSAGAPLVSNFRIGDEEMGDAASRAALARLGKAVSELKALSTVPLLRQALAALGEEDPKAAADLALKALKQDEQSGLAWYLLAIAREKVGDFKSSISCYEAALALTPNPADIANDLGRLAFRLNMKSLAAKLFRIYLDAYPDCPQGTNNLACALRDLHEYAAAIDVLRPTIQAHPESTALWNTLGTILSDQGDMASSLTFFDEALRLDPGFAKARYNRANSLLDLGDAETALRECEIAIAGAQTPSDLAMMKLARATMLLCLGRIGEGWDVYEARLDEHFANATRFMIDRPRWTPDSDLAGKSLLVVGEQGLGDEVSFTSLLPELLAALGPDGRLHLALEPRLIPLYQRSFPGVTVSAHSTINVDGYTVRRTPFVADQSAIDLWAPLASLPRRFRRALSDFPDRPSFLSADPERIAYWRQMLAQSAGPKVGLLWKSLKLDGARLRHFSPFDQWRPVLETPGVSFVNLQYGDCEAELAQAREQLGLNIWQPPEINLKNDLDDVAALCCAMDLVIGPANATTNIAAACGAPVWLISTPAAWPRFGTPDYPWYRRIRVFTPEQIGDWPSVMGEMAAALGAWAGDVRRD